MSQSDDHREESAKRSSPVRRWDLVVLLVIGIVLVGMLFPAITRIQRAAHSPACSNNIRQIGLALQSANAAFNHVPPAFGIINDKPNAGGKDGFGAYPATLFYHLLPHLEQPGTYQRLPPLFNHPAPNQYVLAPNPPLGGLEDENAAQFKVPSYVCPSDITGDSSGVQNLSLLPGNVPATFWGENCYAANYLLFGLVAKPKLPESVPDGLSTTIFFTEKAPSCSDPNTGRQGGNLWAAATFFPADPQARYNYGGTFGYDPSPANPTKPFSVALFQTVSPGSRCDPALAQTPHDGGINVAMGDGSARFISNSVSPKTWSALLTPYPIAGISFPAGEKQVSDVPGADWQ